MLKETYRNEGGRLLKTSTKKEPVFIPTLQDLGLDYKTSSLAQKIAEATGGDAQRTRYQKSTESAEGDG